MSVLYEGIDYEASSYREANNTWLLHMSEVLPAFTRVYMYVIHGVRVPPEAPYSAVYTEMSCDRLPRHRLFLGFPESKSEC